MAPGCICGCDADEAVAHAIAAALAVDDVDAALTAGLLSENGCPRCMSACRQAVASARASRMQALAARERYRARAARLARRDAELQARRRASTAATVASHGEAGTLQAGTASQSKASPSIVPALPTAAADALASAKARAASRHPR